MNNIVIVGGGTAGWMAAISIASRFPQKHITVIDPDVIAPIGVGESVTGVVLSYIADPLHRLNKAEFFRRCDVTFKTGIWYKNWRGPGTEYLGPIDNPPAYLKYFYPSYVEDFYAAITAEGGSVGETTLYGRLMRASRTDHVASPDGTVDAENAQVSCHFDSLKFAAWLKEQAASRANIHWVDDVVESFEQDGESGHVTRIRTRGGRAIEGELFLDCTGFHRLLLARAYKPKWLSYTDNIRVDTAIPCFMPHAAGQPMPTYTTATALSSGWIWQIPTQSRLGRGYLFSSRYTDVQGAIAEMRAAGVDPGDNPRVLKFDPGRFEKAWIGNVCTIGLSGGFLEPLEATTIHGMSVQIQLLTELYLPSLTRQSLATMAEQYNRLITIAYDDYLDFISFHYHTGRSDSEFWRDYQKPSAITPVNQFRLEKWRSAYPTREDFCGIFTQRAALATSMVVWAPMICGMGLLRPEHARRVMEVCAHRPLLQENLQRYVQMRSAMLNGALTHAEAIAYSRQ